MELPVKLKNLIRNLSLEVIGSKEVEITGISSDSRTLFPGNLFLAKRGAIHDGTQFISQAINAGAAAIVTDLFDPFIKCTQLICPFPQKVEALLASRYYGSPSLSLDVIGVTGTKGKTTTSYLIHHVLNGIGLSCGLMSTVEIIMKEHRFASTLTTHDPIFNQKWLKEMVQQKCVGAVMEVSSHGLDQGRVDEIAFDLGVFTNLYPDHLDYHQTMEAYAAAKRKLFERAKKGIFNADSPWDMGKGLSYGIEKGDIRAENVRLGAEGTTFEVEGIPFHIPLIGKFNVYNTLASIAVGIHKGAKLSTLSDILHSFQAVPARLERLGNVFIDFAHNGEALEHALSTLKEIAKGKVIVVFGCGGNRDPNRRVGMAKAADRLADIAIITNDNPRKEDPEEIARQITMHFKRPPLVELDRKKAIEKAMQMASQDDVVLIAGKGHEKVQIFAHQTVPFDDAAIVRDVFNLNNQNS